MLRFVLLLLCSANPRLTGRDMRGAEWRINGEAINLGLTTVRFEPANNVRTESTDLIVRAVPGPWTSGLSARCHARSLGELLPYN